MHRRHRTDCQLSDGLHQLSGHMSILRQHLPEMQCGGTIEKDKLILLKMRIKYYIQLILAFSALLLTGCTSQNALNTSTTLDTKAHFENIDAAFEDAHDDSIFQATEPDPYWGVPLEAIRSLDDIPIYQGKDLGIADISILSNRLSFSVASESGSVSPDPPDHLLQLCQHAICLQAKHPYGSDGRPRPHS